MADRRVARQSVKLTCFLARSLAGWLYDAQRQTRMWRVCWAANLRSSCAIPLQYSSHSVTHSLSTFARAQRAEDISLLRTTKSLRRVCDYAVRENLKKLFAIVCRIQRHRGRLRIETRVMQADGGERRVKEPQSRMSSGSGASSRTRGIGGESECDARDGKLRCGASGEM